jgi:N-acetylglutamate synthase-like GNAT family acetyltransferase
MTLKVRDASASDAGSLAALITAAYRVEDFFKIGDRIDADGVLDKMQHGRFIVLEEAGRLRGSVYVEASSRRGYFGMLSIDPSHQKQGLGGWLIEVAETACRKAGCTEMEIEVVNLRAELPAYYAKFGYIEVGTRQFPDDERTSMPCHFIVMRKPLS